MNVRKYREYSDFSSEIDLVAEGGDAGPGPKRVAELKIITAGGGTLSIRGRHNQTSTLTNLVAGDNVPLEDAAAILTATNVGRLRVGWA